MMTWIVWFSVSPDFLVQVVGWLYQPPIARPRAAPDAPTPPPELWLTNISHKHFSSVDSQSQKLSNLTMSNYTSVVGVFRILQQVLAMSNFQLIVLLSTWSIWIVSIQFLFQSTALGFLHSQTPTDMQAGVRAWLTLLAVLILGRSLIQLVIGGVGLS